MPEFRINRTLLDLLHAVRHLSNLFTKFLETPPPPAKEEKWLRDEDVMKIFNVTEKTIYNWKKKGTLPYRDFGGTSFYLESEIYKINQ